MEVVKNLSQLCFPILLILVFYIPDSVMGEIGVNCGSGAVVGQPYTMKCTNIPDTVNNGINVFLGGDVNSIITCIPSKNCLPQNTSLYNVVTPHNESLFFTILDVKTDDIGKKLYCLDGGRPAPSDPSCTLALVQTTAVPETSTTRITDEQTNPDCDGCLSGGAIAGIVIGVIVVCAVVIIVIVVIYKKKKSERASL